MYVLSLLNDTGMKEVF